MNKEMESQVNHLLTRHAQAVGITNAETCPVMQLRKLQLNISAERVKSRANRSSNLPGDEIYQEAINAVIAAI